MQLGMWCGEDKKYSKNIYNNPLAPNTHTHTHIYIYICHAVNPLNGRTAIKVDGGGGGFNSGVKGLNIDYKVVRLRNGP